MAETTILGYVPLDLAGGTMTGDLILNADPTDPLGAATKDYVDNASGGGGGTLAPVLAANTVAYTAIYDNGVSGVGATLTNDDTLAAFTIDGLAGVLNGRYLIRVASSNAHHGIYTLTTVGDGSTPWVLTRSDDFDTSEKMAIGTTVFSAGWDTFYLWGFMLGNSVATVGASGIDFYSIAAPIYTLPAVPVNGFQDMAFQDSGNLSVNLITDTDSTYSLGDASYRWNALFVNEIRNGTTNGDETVISARDTGNSLYLPFVKVTAGAPPTCTLGAYDVDGAAYVPFVTLTSGNTPTCVLASSVTATTQSPADNSTKLATTAYVEAAVTAGGGLAAASQAQMEAASSNTVAATPGRTQYHPGVAKWWLKANGAGTTVNASHNVTSITDTGTGQLTITIATDFSSADWAGVATLCASNGGAATIIGYFSTTTQAAGSIQLNSSSGGGTLADPASSYFACGFGDQA